MLTFFVVKLKSKCLKYYAWKIQNVNKWSNGVKAATATIQWLRQIEDLNLNCKEQN